GVAAETDPRIELEDSALQIVVKRADRRSAELAAELPGVLARKPGEVVKDLVALAGAATRDAISNRTSLMRDEESEESRLRDRTCTRVGEVCANAPSRDPVPYPPGDPKGNIWWLRANA